MESRAARKSATREYLERRVPRGVFTITCTTTGQVWVGASPNLEAARNSAWFTLRSGIHRHGSLQQTWTAQGEAAFVYDIVEELEEDVAALVLPDLLKRKKAEWVAHLDAEPLLP